MTLTKKSAAYVIAFHLGWDMKEVTDNRYQPTRYHAPAVYTCGDHDWCCPTGSQKPPDALGQWEEVAVYDGRKVYRTSAKD